MPDESKKSNWKTSLFPLIVDKLLIALIVASTIIYFQHKSSENLQNLQTSNQVRIDSLNKIHEARLNEIQKEKDNSAQKLLEEYVKDLELKNEIQLLGKSYEVELQKINAQLRNDSILQVESINTDNEKDINRVRLNYITRQLEEFYWPILIRLEKNKSVFDMLHNQFVGDNLDTVVILPNYLEIIDVIEKKIHLAQADEYLQNHISYFINHVYMYQAIRQKGLEGFPEDYAGYNFNDEFYQVIKKRTKIYQTRYNELIKIIEGTDHSIISDSTDHKFTLDYKQTAIDIYFKLEKKNSIENKILYIISGSGESKKQDGISILQHSKKGAKTMFEENSNYFTYKRNINSNNSNLEIPLDMSIALKKFNTNKNTCVFSISFKHPELDLIEHREEMIKNEYSYKKSLNPSLTKTINIIDYIIQKDILYSKYTRELNRFNMSYRTDMMTLSYDTLYQNNKLKYEHLQKKSWTSIIDQNLNNENNTVVFDYKNLRFRLLLSNVSELNKNLYKVKLFISSWKQNDIILTEI